MTPGALAARASSAFTTATQIPDGVWIGLDEDVYFGQDAIGSTDLTKLWHLRHGWWWQSRYNPDRIDKSRLYLNYGKALHAILLEGLGAYEARFAVQPERPADAVETVDEMKQALRDVGLRVDGPGSGTSAWRKPEWAMAMRTQAAEVPCWPNMLEDFEDSIGRKTVVSAVEDRMLRIMYATAFENPEIAELLTQDGQHPPLAEISVLKTFPNGVRRRWRFDRLFPAFTVDLKSLGNYRGRPLPFEVGDAIAKHGYDIQRADYHDGRAAAYEFIANGFQVHGGTLEQRNWLAKFPENFISWDWVWLFYQKPEPSGRAPIIFPVYDDYGSELQGWGAAKAFKAGQFYLEMVARFGLDRPWTHVEALHYTREIQGKPRVHFPHWVAEDEPTAEEAAYPDGEG